jgi:hypothetical protein
MMRKPFQRPGKIAGAFLLLLVCVVSAAAQVTTGNIAGTVTDPQGAAVAGAEVTLTDKGTGQSQTQQTSETGEFRFSNLQPGDYNITIKGQSFRTLTLTDVRVSLGQTTDVPAQLTIGLAGETVEVSAAGTELVDTSTTTLSKTFSERQVVELAQTSVGSGVNNLALIAPNVSSSGGVGVGTGGSVGGQRPRNNNFMLDGIDNNDKSVTGPQSYISPEEVAEFTLLQNQFSAEFARSNGGQFLTVTKSGTNDFHGTFYGFFRNKKFNALDTQLKNAGVTRATNPRYDYFRGGANFSGPLPLPRFGEGGPSYYSGKNKLFFFTSYERLQQGAGASASSIIVPTAEGFATIRNTPGISQNNLSVLTQYLPVASAANVQTSNCVGADCITVGGRSLALGEVFVPSPNFFKQNHVVENIDYSQSSKTQHKFRFTLTNGADIDNSANLPVFFTALPSKQRLFSYTLLHTFTSNLSNETRIAFRRSSQAFEVPGFAFPGLDAFPNITLDDLGVNIGPDPNAPQFGIENNYQVVNNVSYLAGSHSLKVGGDFRKIISPQRFVQRERGDYEYNSTEDFLFDRSPVFAERNVGGNTYYGDQKILYAFGQDDWRVRPNLTLNLGLSYSYQEVPKGAKFQAANAISSVPGLLEFRAPKSQTKNFGPRVGFAYSPNYSGGLLGRLFGENGKTSIRAGFSMAYDYIFDNLYILSNPPQAQQTIDCPDATNPRCPATNFLASGGITPNPTAGLTNAATARAVTGSFIPDQEVPYSLSYTGSIQRQFLKDWSVEVRYLGTRGIHLLTQNRINVQARVAPDQGRPGLPTFLTAPSQAQINALTLTLDQINARPRIIPSYAAAGFTNNVIGFLSNGNSTYHGGSALLQKRFSRGLQMSSAYTFSHLIDDTTAEVFSTVLAPRRVEDFQNLRKERANSALDRRHRFVHSMIYELPFFRTSSNDLARVLLGGFNFAGTYTMESGQPVTIRSGTDANLNGDNAGDRAIFNPAGQEGLGTGVTALRRSTDNAIVGYVANNPNARYIQAAAGAVSNIGRNTFSTPRINNLDFSIFKNFRVGETKFFQLRADMFNALNHPQYVPGSVNTVDPIGTTGVTQFNQVSPVTPNFLRPDQVFSSNPRLIQLAARFNF